MSDLSYLIVYVLYGPMCTIIGQFVTGALQVPVIIIIVHYQQQARYNERTYSARIVVALARLAFVLVVDETEFTVHVT